MSISPVVLKSQSVPFQSMASAVVLVYFIVKSLVFGGAVAAFSLFLGAIAALVGLWALWSARKSSVVIDGDTFTVVRRGRATSYERSRVSDVDLSGLDRHLTLDDGTGVRLPLEGKALVEAGLLLGPQSNAF